MWRMVFYGPSQGSMVRFPNDRNPDCRLSHSMRRFNEVLNELGLRDLPLQGGVLSPGGVASITSGCPVWTDFW